jgi:hypothetical protein
MHRRFLGRSPDGFLDLFLGGSLRKPACGVARGLRERFLGGFGLLEDLVSLRFGCPESEFQGRSETVSLEFDAVLSR